VDEVEVDTVCRLSTVDYRTEDRQCSNSIR